MEEFLSAVVFAGRAQKTRSKLYLALSLPVGTTHALCKLRHWAHADVGPFQAPDVGPLQAPDVRPFQASRLARKKLKFLIGLSKELGNCKIL